MDRPATLETFAKNVQNLLRWKQVSFPQKKIFLDEDPLNEEKIYSWIDKKLEHLTDKYRSVNIENLEGDNPYIEYRCLGGVGYHLRSNIMFKAIMDMSNNMDRALPNARGTSFMTRKVRECFFRKEKSFVPH